MNSKISTAVPDNPIPTHSGQSLSHSGILKIECRIYNVECRTPKSLQNVSPYTPIPRYLYTLFHILSFIIFTSILTGCDRQKTSTADSVSAIRDINYSVVKSHPHSTLSFTEGLLVHEGKLFESTGSPEDLPEAQSMVGIVDLNTGNMDVKIQLDRGKYFGEGIAFLKGKLYQLTYTTKIGFIYDAVTFNKVGEFAFPNKEGWALTTDGTHLIMSDGTNALSFLDGQSLKTVKKVSVYDNNGDVTRLNELEYIQGFIYANIYGTDYVVKIDPTSGEVVGRLDLTSLVLDIRSKNPNALELNGIAYDPATRNVYVTGKLWPAIFEIKFKL